MLETLSMERGIVGTRRTDRGTERTKLINEEQSHQEPPAGRESPSESLTQRQLLPKHKL